MRRPAVRALALLCILAVPAALLAQSASGGPLPPDAGPGRAVTPEDQEVIDNLELLEHLDESKQLELLLELSRDD